MKRVALALLMLGAGRPAFAAPALTSDSECPSAAEVTAHIANLWRGERALSGAAHIRQDGARLHIDLAGEDEPVVTRSLPVDADCRSRAQAAALVIAAWLDTANADLIGLAAPLPPTPTPASDPLRPTSPPSAPQLMLGLGGFASVDSGGAGALLAPEAAWLRLLGQMGLRAGLSFPLPRTMTVGYGSSRWWRPGLDVGMVLSLNQGPWNLWASAGPVLGLLVVTGKGFDENHTDVVLSWGALAGLRLSRTRPGGGAVWAELRGLLWPWAQSIRNEVMGSPWRESALPRLEGHLGLGFSYAVF